MKRKSIPVSEMREQLDVRFKHIQHLSNVEVRRMYNSEVAPFYEIKC